MRKLNAIQILLLLGSAIVVTRNKFTLQAPVWKPGTWKCGKTNWTCFTSAVIRLSSVMGIAILVIGQVIFTVMVRTEKELTLAF